MSRRLYNRPPSPGGQQRPQARDERRAEGLEQGMLRAQRQTLLDVVQERFPEIVHLAKKQADAIEDPEVLRRLTVRISVVKTSQEAEQHLLNPSSVENRH